MDKLIRIVALLAILYVGLCVALYLFQGALIYFPQPNGSGTPETTMVLVVDDAELQVSIRPHEGPRALIYFGGNAEDVSWNLSSFSEAFPDHALYLLHYRGFGGSSGTPSEEANSRDALDLFDKVFQSHSSIVLVGRSLGSGVAVRLASQRTTSHLILITPFESLVEIAQQQYRFVPVKWLMRDKYDSGVHAAQVTAPTVLLAAEHDRVIPRASTERLLGRFPHGVASLEVLAYTDHNSISGSPRYLEAMRAAVARGPKATDIETAPDAK